MCFCLEPAFGEVTGLGVPYVCCEPPLLSTVADDFFVFLWSLFCTGPFGVTPFGETPIGETLFGETPFEENPFE